jgi:hypothetical protein
MKETDLNLSASSFSHLPVRYEQLRQQRLDGVFTRAINVFVQKGMCGWIHAWTDRIPAADGESGFYSENPLKKDPWHMHRLANGDGDKAVGELVELIASMALTKIKGGVSCERKSA